MSFFVELKRRNVFKVGIAYVVASWLILQLTEVLSELLELGTDIGKIVIILLIVGFIPALIFAWAFELTPEGVKRESEVDRSQSITPRTGRRLDFYIIGMLALALVYFIWESRFSEKVSEPFAHESPERTEVIQDEKRDPTPLGGKDGKSIAVLPFTNRSPNPDDIYFTDGVHDDLLTQLAKIGAFSVISRTSVMEYRDTAKNLKEIAAELGVANVMEGAVQRSGNRVRINVQLIDANTDEHLWAEVYDRQLTTENLFDIQSEIAQAIAGALHATLSDNEIASVADVPTDNVEAYELYLQARRFALGETEIGFDTAIELYEAALELDPGFKLAWIGLAKAHITNYWQYGGDPVDRDNAREAIDRARDIDADFPELNMAEGFYWYWGHLDYDQAIAFLEKAVAQMPGLAEAHMWLGWALRRDGQWERAIASMQESLRLDPRVVIHWAELANTFAKMKRHDEALVAAQTAYDLNPDSYWSRYELGSQLIKMAGDVDRAVTLMVGAQHTGDVASQYQFVEVNWLARNYDAVLDAAALIRPEDEMGRSYILMKESVQARTLALAGRLEEAREQAGTAFIRLEELNAAIPYDYRFSLARAELFAILGEGEQALALVDEALTTMPVDAVESMQLRFWAARSLALAGLSDAAVEQLGIVLQGYSDPSHIYVQLDPFFDPIRDDPGYNELMEGLE